MTLSRIAYRWNLFLGTMSLALLLVLAPAPAGAQGGDLQKARHLALDKKYPEAIELYERLYAAEPNAELFEEYFDALLKAKKYKDAEKLLPRAPVQERLKAVELINQGRIELAQGKTKRANDLFDQALGLITGDEMITIRMVNLFQRMELDDYSVQTYERARSILNNPYFYGEQLARLYAKKGELEKAVVTFIQSSPWQQGGLESTKATLLELVGNDAKAMQQLQKALIKKINEQPNNANYVELLTWLYTHKNDWEGALVQVQAVDQRNREEGLRLMEFARIARKERRYEVATKAYDAVLEKGTEKQFYTTAGSEKLSMQFQQLQENPAYTEPDVARLSAAYEAFLKDVPHYYATETAREYATLLALYANEPQKGIDVLQLVISQPHVRKDISGMAKLQMGDYQVLLGNIWEASLLYSQVDKANREDMLGEEARFRNAKLSYYRGDFTWAQGQLKVLKASTSELIANDALSLSVLITENSKDSNTDALARFAYADLLLFQNKDKEAAALLDSISEAFPKHSLQDDILMLHARIADKHRDYARALTYYEKVVNKYGTDVLGDDAIFQSAQLYDVKLNKPEDARRYYEDLIVRYPGSTYVQTARKRLKELSQPASLP
ncbi:MAG: tetratricopeptide repeat protein [Flavipsychrobacter sp.]|nr:tetratricopeptide repeat protein [Flavipsychrobacter sp.]